MRSPLVSGTGTLPVDSPTDHSYPQPNAVNNSQLRDGDGANAAKIVEVYLASRWIPSGLLQGRLLMRTRHPFLKRMNADDTPDIFTHEVRPSTRQPRDQQYREPGHHLGLGNSTAGTPARPIRPRGGMKTQADGVSGRDNLVGSFPSQACRR